jgi:hypothetical protein
MKALIAIAMVVTGTPLLAADPAPADGASNAPPPPRQICRRVEAISGSHVSRARVCRTAAQWRAMSDSSTDDANDTFTTLGSSPHQPTDGYTSSRGGAGGLPPR